MEARPSIVIILGGTKAPRGGMTSSALNRATQLSRRGYRVTICTFDYRPDHISYINGLKEEGLVGRDVVILNFYEHLKALGEAGRKTQSVVTPDVSAFILQKENLQLTRFFTPSGSLAYTERYGDGQSVWRRFYTDNRMEKRRIEYSTAGTLHRETVFFENSLRPSSVSYLDRSGHTYFTQWMNNAGTDADVFVASPHEGGHLTRHKTLGAAQEHWFHSVISEISETVIIMIDDCTMSPVVRNLKSDNARSIAIFHNDHRIASHKSLIAGMDSWNAVVCSTQGQSLVLREIVPEGLEITSIPQPIPDRVAGLLSQTNPVERLAFFGRLEPVKNVLLLVSAFASVVESMPSASLDIYGSGSQESDIRKLVSDLRLENSVRLMGQSNSPQVHMTEYVAVILPSAFEAFGLVVGEAMLAETPVIAFDCDFGPKDIIADRIDGILVDSGDFGELAHQMLSVLRNPEAAQIMGQAGRQKVLERYNNERIMNDWEKLIRRLTAK